MASRRKRRAAALRPCLLSGLPLSDVTELYAPIEERRQFGDTRSKRCPLWVVKRPLIQPRIMISNDRFRLRSIDLVVRIGGVNKVTRCPPSFPLDPR